eukprot:GHVT01025909.1.p1 GENE.GHVT01025909.1~~GHVT01025909.1.p1  ORF type:complete len:118 (+),score=13.35 GHVT01025909.1:420-773(+)
MALNAAMFGSVLLASRLVDCGEVYGFLFFAVEIFALSPMIRRYLWQTSPSFCLYFLTPILFAITAAVLRSMAPIAVYLYVFGMIFITFVGPLWLIRSQKYKNEIKGPWDIAHVRPSQ